jgi:hypothetical protein
MSARSSYSREVPGQQWLRRADHCIVVVSQIGGVLVYSHLGASKIYVVTNERLFRELFEPLPPTKGASR